MQYTILMYKKHQQPFKELLLKIINKKLIKLIVFLTKKL